jgi:hypothetical protein
VNYPKTNHLATMQTADGTIHSPYGSFHPVTGEGLPIDAPQEFMDDILRELIQQGLDSGLAEDFDLDEFMREKFGDN